MAFVVIRNRVARSVKVWNFGPWSALDCKFSISASARWRFEPWFTKQRKSDLLKISKMQIIPINPWQVVKSSNFVCKARTAFCKSPFIILSFSLSNFSSSSSSKKKFFFRKAAKRQENPKIPESAALMARTRANSKALIHFWRSTSLDAFKWKVCVPPLTTIVEESSAWI